QHEQYGDGYALANGFFQKLRLLFTWSNTVVSIDGYKSVFLQKAFNKYKKRFPKGDFVIIGHPKAFTPYSLKKTDAFFKREYSNIEIICFEQP
ncbi:MAG: hypothetical protein GYB39_09515, partial [Algicola sp.]|nr:hypothetical protein [Algicola sp.]